MILLRGGEGEGQGGKSQPIALNQQHGCVRIVARQCVARRDCGRCNGVWNSDTKSDDEGRNVVRRLESQVDTDDEEPLLPPSSPAEEVIRAFEVDLRSQPRASKARRAGPLSHREGRPHQFTMREMHCFPRRQLSRQQMHLRHSQQVQEQFDVLFWSRFAGGPHCPSDGFHNVGH